MEEQLEILGGTVEEKTKRVMFILLVADEGDHTEEVDSVLLHGSYDVEALMSDDFLAEHILPRMRVGRDYVYYTHLLEYDTADVRTEVVKLSEIAEGVQEGLYRIVELNHFRISLKGDATLEVSES